MSPIFLIGFMGCGKSTLGRALGDATGLQFIDLDSYIERRFHASVREIFDRDGESGFRDLEHRMLAEVSQFEDVIVACGGGTPCHFNNIDLMNNAGTVVWLQASMQKLLDRLKLGRMRRPLIARLSDPELEEYIRTALDARTPAYSKALHTFCADHLDDAESIERSTANFISTFHLPVK